MKKAIGSNKTSDQNVEAVRIALAALSPPSQQPALGDRRAVEGVVRFEEFYVTEQEGSEHLFLPVDGDAPGTPFVSQYLMKQMEYVETFLVASRLGRELGHVNLLPKGVDLRKHLGVILRCVGREIGKERAKKLKYEPLPHLAASPEVPFVDFAGFLTVILLDYLQWEGLCGDPVAVAAREELDTAIEFLIHPETYIEDDAGVGWGFIPNTRCATNRMMPTLAEHRHILPTSWAVVAIQRYCASPLADDKLKNEASQVLKRVLGWIKRLVADEGLFYSTQARRAPNLAGHNYATEALVTLAEADVEGAPGLAVKAIERFVEELDRGDDALRDFEVNIVYPVFIKERPLVQYTDHTTWATCLATLAYAVSVLTDADSAELKSNARTHCNSMALQVSDRRNDANLWQRGWLQFHWTMTAVEALLRVSVFAIPETFVITTDAVVQAVSSVLDNKAFKAFLRDSMIAAIKRAGKLGDTYSAEAEPFSLHLERSGQSESEA